MDKNEYRCTRCGRGQEAGVDRSKLLVKKSIFTTMGRGGKTVRSRVVDWLCDGCVKQDDDWNQVNTKGQPRTLGVPLG